MSTPPAKVVVLSIDAANPGLLRRWGADGTVPNFGALMARGWSVRPAVSMDSWWGRPGLPVV